MQAPAIPRASSLLAELDLAFLDHLLPAVVFALLGMGLFGLAWVLVVKISPFSIRKEIEEDHNVALSIILGALLIGLAIIIAAAVG